MQKFNKGDHIQVAKDLGSCMSHFQNDCEAIVMYTYNEKYGGGDIDSYCIHIKGHGQVSWYHEGQLKLIQADRLNLLEQWEDEAKQEADMKSGLDWIFENGKDVLESAHGATVSALAKCFGLTNLWGSNGEGITYHTNSMLTMQFAKPFLEAGDKDGWLDLCKSIASRKYEACNSYLEVQ